MHGRETGRWPLWAAAALILTGCGPVAPADNGAMDDDASGATNAPAGNVTSARSPTDGPLSAYVGQYPFDPVAGVAFRDHPLVRAALVQAGGTNAPVDRILDGPGPSTPIARTGDGRILSWGCEQHNCGPHNWALILEADGSNGELCYHDEDATPATVWLIDGRPTSRDEQCPSGN